MGHKVLRGVSYAIASGTLVGIVGENGAGKSTLLRSGAMGYCPQQVILNEAPNAAGQQVVLQRPAYLF